MFSQFFIYINNSDASVLRKKKNQPKYSIKKLKKKFEL